MKMQDLKKRLAANKVGFFIFFVFLVFFLIRGACLIKTTDDVWWDKFDSLSDMMKGYNPNGRLFTNALTYYICNHDFVRVIVYVASLGLFLLSIARMLEVDLGKGKWTPIFFSGLVIILSPRYFSPHVYNWISGFTNYTISAFLVLWYMRFCTPLFERKEIKASKAAPVLCLICGVLGALCVENITIYNLVFGAFIIILSLVTLKKVSLSNIAFMAGTVIGTVMMFLNQQYSEILSEGDSIGFRSFDLDLTDCMMKIYVYFTHYLLSPYFVLNIIIALSVLALYNRRLKSGGAKLKYAKLFIPIIVIFAVYSFFTVNVDEFTVMSQAYRIKALEAALTALYIMGLCYMTVGLFEGGKRIRAIIYIMSTLMTTAPFIVVNPITSRCFFAGFLFWAMYTFTLAAELIKDTEFEGSDLVKRSAAVFSASFLFILAYMDVSNKYADAVRTKHIRAQLADDARFIEVIRLPYEHACFDPAEMLIENTLEYEDNGRVYYSQELYCMSNDIDLAFVDKERMFIGMIDYNTSRDNQG